MSWQECMLVGVALSLPCSIAAVLFVWAFPVIYRVAIGAVLLPIYAVCILWNMVPKKGPNNE